MEDPPQALTPPASRIECVARDAADGLAGLRERFVLPDGVIYLDGNSLGPLPREAAARLARVISREWGEQLIRSWNDAGWFELPLRLGDRVGALIGAAPGQTVVCDTTSVNVFKALHAAMRLRPDRDVIVAEAGSFPTDLYMIEGAIAAAGGRHRMRLIGTDGPTLESLLDERVAAVVLSHVDFRTGALRDLAGDTRRAQEAGALVIWDVCHSVGVVPIAFDADAIDFAVGCTYKYVNAGPGAPAFVSVARRHLDAARQPLSGWWGHAAPFAFETGFRPDAGIRKFLCGTQPILSMRGVEFALDALEGFSIAALRAKSLSLTGLFMARLDAWQAAAGPAGEQIAIATPREARLRGSQVSVACAHAYPVVQALAAQGVIGDFREPDIMRFGFAPAYLRHADAWDAAEALTSCLDTGTWREPRFAHRAVVT